jgi:hypothetical protein
VKRVVEWVVTMEGVWGAAMVAVLGSSTVKVRELLSAIS